MATSLDGKTVLVTGSSRGIGAETVQQLAKQGAAVAVNYRDKAKRAERVAQGIEADGGKAICVQADLTKFDTVTTMFGQIKDAFGGLDVLVLNASGGMEKDADQDYALLLNRDAQVNAIKTALPLMKEGSRIVFVTSHQAHFINDVPTMPEYEPVARSKRAGEDAIVALIPELSAKGIDLVIVSGDMIEGTITASLLNRTNEGAIEQRRAAAGGHLPDIPEFAAEIAKAATMDAQSGHVVFVGGQDYLK